MPTTIRFPSPSSTPRRTAHSRPPAARISTSPDPLFAGADWLSYQASDGADESNLAYLFFYVDNHDPFVDSDSFNLVHDTSVGDIDLASYASDPNDDPLTISVVDAPQYGQFTLGGDGKYTYTPNALFAGADYITFQATDPVNGGTASNLGTLFFYVNNYDPFVDTDSFNLVHDTPLTGIDLNAYASDEDGDPLTFTIVDAPEHGQFTLGGDGKYTYTPAALWTGSDYLTYQASDPVNGGTLSNLGYLYFNVNNYEPVATALNGHAFYVRQNQTLENIDLLALGFDEDGDALELNLGAGPWSGQLTQNAGGLWDYTPLSNWIGTDTFNATFTDGIATSGSAYFYFHVVTETPAELYDTYLAAVAAADSDYLIAVADRDAAIAAARASAQAEAVDLYAAYEAAVDQAQAPFHVIEASHQDALADADATWEIATAAARSTYDDDLVDAQDAYDVALATIQADHQDAVAADDAVYNDFVAPYLAARDSAYAAWQAAPEDEELEEEYNQSQIALDAAEASAELVRVGDYAAAQAAYDLGVSDANVNLVAAQVAAWVNYADAVAEPNADWENAKAAAWAIYSEDLEDADAEFASVESAAWATFSADLADVEMNLATAEASIATQFEIEVSDASTIWHAAEAAAWEPYETAMAEMLGLPALEPRIEHPPALPFAALANAPRLEFVGSTSGGNAARYVRIGTIGFLGTGAAIAGGIYVFNRVAAASVNNSVHQAYNTATAGRVLRFRTGAFFFEQNSNASIATLASESGANGNLLNFERVVRTDFGTRGVVNSTRLRARVTYVILGGDLPLRTGNVTYTVSFFVEVNFRPTGANVDSVVMVPAGTIIGEFNDPNLQSCELIQ